MQVLLGMWEALPDAFVSNVAQRGLQTACTRETPSRPGRCKNAGRSGIQVAESVITGSSKPAYAGDVFSCPGYAHKALPVNWCFRLPAKEGVHTSYFPIAKQWGKARGARELPDGTVLYSAQHSFATDMLDKTGNVVLVRNPLGREPVTTT
jgi:hypothetical protein